LVMTMLKPLSPMPAVFNRLEARMMVL
jgi:hypothetical protein